MPVTAKLSKAFYDKIGEQPANDLVIWMNEVHESARADLREFNELNFTRFNARLDQSVAVLDARMDGLEARMDRLEVRMDRLEVRMDRLEAKIDALPDAALFDAKFAAFMAHVDARFERAQKDTIRLVFLAWMTLLIPMLTIALRR